VPDGWVLSRQPHSSHAGESLDHESASLTPTQAGAFLKLALKDEEPYMGFIQLLLYTGGILAFIPCYQLRMLACLMLFLLLVGFALQQPMTRFPLGRY